MANAVTPEQLAMVDQLNQKLANAEITAQQYAEAIKQGGLEQAHHLNLLDQQIAKAQTLIGLYQQMGGQAKEIAALEQQVIDKINQQSQLRNQNITQQQSSNSQETQKNQKLQLQEALQKSIASDIKEQNIWGGSMIQTMTNIAMEAESVGQAIGRWAEGIGQGIFNDFIAGMSHTVMAADSMLANLNATTGAAGSMNAMVLDSTTGMASLGVGLDDAGKAAGSLYTEFNQFSSMNSQMQTQLVQTSAGLEKLGIDSSVTARNMDLMTNAFGMSASQANKMNKDLAKTALAVGMPPAQMAAEFQKAAPQLASYGAKGMEVFKNMAAASKGLGVSMDTLLGLTSQFDTFDGAAQAAGNLNAMLGGDLLNSMDLLNATEDERIEMILQSVDASGKSWNSMSKFEKMAVANAAGITDMAEANKLFGGGLAGYQKAQAEMAKNKKSEEELAAAQAASISITQQLTLMKEQMVVALGPVISAIRMVVGGILSMNDAMGGLLIPVVFGGIAALYALYKIVQMVRFAQTALATVKGVLAGRTLAAAAADQIETIQIYGLIAADKVSAASKAVRTQVTNLATAATQTSTGATLREAAATSFATAKRYAGIAAEKISAAAKIAAAAAATGLASVIAFLTGAKAAETTQTTLSNAATQGSIVSKLREGAVTAATTMQKWAAIAADKAMAAGKYILAAASGGAVLASMKEAAATTTSKVAQLGSAAADKASAAGKYLLAGATGAATAASNLNIMATLRSGALKSFELGKTVALAVAEKGMAAGRMVLAGVTALLTFVFGGQAAAQSGVAATAGPAAVGTGAMGAASAGAAGPVFVLGVGMGLLAIGFGLVAIAIAAIVWAFVYLISLFMEAPGAAVLAAGALLVMGVAVAILTGIFAALAPVAPIAAAAMITLGIGMLYLVPPIFLLGLGFMFFALALSMMPGGAAVAMLGLALALIPFAIALFFAAPMLILAAILIAPASILLAFGLTFLGFGVSMLAPHAPNMMPIAAGLVPFAFALMLAAPMLLLAGIFMLIAGIFFAPGALLIGTGLWALSWAAPSFEQMLLLPEVAAALMMAAPMLFWAGLFMLIAGPTFIAGSIMIAIGMAILAGPLMQFAQAVAVMGPFIPALPMLALGLIMLGIALPIFGMGLLILGIIASMPFFDTGLGVLTEALYTFADAMSGIPTEKAKALGQIFAGLGNLTDMKGVGAGLMDFAFGIRWMGWGLSTMPDGERLKLMAEGLKMFAETGAKTVLPVSIALYAAAPYLLAAARDLKPAAFWLYIAGKPLNAGMFWVAKAFSWFGQTEAEKGLKVVSEHFLKAAIGLFFGAPLLFFASVWLFLAGPLFFWGAMWLAMGLWVLNEPLFEFAITMMLLEPLIPTLTKFFAALSMLSQMNNVYSVLHDLHSEIYYLGRALADIPEEALIKARFLADDAIMPMAELASVLTPESIQHASDLVDQAERYMHSQIAMKSFPDDAFAQAVVAGASGMGGMGEKGAGGGGEGEGKGHDVILVLNERELGRAMEVYLNKRINLQIS